MITGPNRFGLLCGVVCPDYFCMTACSRRLFERPIEIPAVQTTMIESANEVRILRSAPAVQSEPAVFYAASEWMSAEFWNVSLTPGHIFPRKLRCIKSDRSPGVATLRA